MMRSARFAIVLAAAFTLGASTARAQTSTPAPDASTRFSAEIAAAATLGHKSASSFGGELDLLIVGRAAMGRFDG